MRIIMDNVTVKSSDQRLILAKTETTHVGHRILRLGERSLVVQDRIIYPIGR